MNSPFVFILFSVSNTCLYTDVLLEVTQAGKYVRDFSFSCEKKTVFSFQVKQKWLKRIYVFFHTESHHRTLRYPTT